MPLVKGNTIVADEFIHLADDDALDLEDRALQGVHLGLQAALGEAGGADPTSARQRTSSRRCWPSRPSHSSFMRRRAFLRTQSRA